MRLTDLLRDLYTPPPAADCEIKRLTLDSRLVQSDDLFFALPGATQDGRQYVEEAIQRGASAVLIDSCDEPCRADVLPVIPLPNLREQLGLLASRFYSDPSLTLKVIGVTGTSGKTSCTHFLAQLLGETAGVVGTLGSGRLAALKESAFATPDPITLQGIFNDFLQNGMQYAAIEVSSHGIHQHRIRGTQFAACLFTNLTQDHLDYHGTMEAYADTKRSFLASQLQSCPVFLNIDDTHGAAWHQAFKANASSLLSYGLNDHHSKRPDLYGDVLNETLLESAVSLQTPWGRGEVVLPLSGQFNISNALAVLGIALSQGMPFEEALKRLARLTPVSGRMERVSGPHEPLVIVDYAHKPGALSQVLLTLRAKVAGRLICVFGCGGERDTLKRPIMAAIAGRYADHVIVTNDNPRNEPPEAIVADILAGFQPKQSVQVIYDRALAIKTGIELAGPNDCVLIAGRGGEKTQKLADQCVVFDDAKVAKQALQSI